MPSGWESKQSDSGGPSQWPYCGRSFNDEAPEGPQTAYPTPQHEMRPFWIPQEHFSSVGSDLPPITAETTACKPLGGWHPACEDGSANGNDPNHGRPIAKAPSTQCKFSLFEQYSCCICSDSSVGIKREKGTTGLAAMELWRDETMPRRELRESPICFHICSFHSINNF